MTRILPKPEGTALAPSPPDRAGPLVVALAYQGLCLFEFSIATEIFGLARPELEPGWYRFAVAAVSPPPLRAQAGLTVGVDGDLSLLQDADLIIVPGWTSISTPCLCR